jgi:phospholipid/cholesterol/gamma-HCH transport system permease protein
VRDLLEIVQQVGPQALGIVTLIGLLVGLILAYIGAIQLEQFGAQLYVANLVGIAMAREMGGIMVGVILAGRTGAAFAAQLGSMQVNEEIDALRTLGVAPVDSLVIPRMLALIVMIPLLCVYALVAGVLGGVLVSVGTLGISLRLYYEQTILSVGINDVWVGVAKSILFGILIALCGCYHGIRCGRSASAVGEATTKAVVSGIVCIVVADAICAILCDLVGI